MFHFLHSFSFKQQFLGKFAMFLIYIFALHVDYQFTCVIIAHVNIIFTSFCILSLL